MKPSSNADQPPKVTQPMWEKLNARRALIFLIDGIGALVTALLLLLVLARFEPLFGMPRKALHGLSLIAFVYSVYSFTCYFTVRQLRPYLLRLLALANLTYCFITLGLILIYSRQITGLGVAYFMGEMLIILSLAFLEWKLGRS